MLVGSRNPFWRKGRTFREGTWRNIEGCQARTLLLTAIAVISPSSQIRWMSSAVVGTLKRVWSINGETLEGKVGGGKGVGRVLWFNREKDRSLECTEEISRDTSITKGNVEQLYNKRDVYCTNYLTLIAARDFNSSGRKVAVALLKNNFIFFLAKYWNAWIHYQLFIFVLLWSSLSLSPLSWPPPPPSMSLPSLR